MPKRSRKVLRLFSAGELVLFMMMASTNMQAAKAQSVPVPISRPEKLLPADKTAPKKDDKSKPLGALDVSPVEKLSTSHSGVEMRALTEEARQYCVNIRDAAADARVAWQTATLETLEKQVAEQVIALEKKRAEYEEWLAKREEFLKQAREDMVAIYSRMRPDAAAGQLAAMDDETAAAVLAKLNARNSSAILNEMEPIRAAQLANMLAGASGMPTKGEQL